LTILHTQTKKHENPPGRSEATRQVHHHEGIFTTDTRYVHLPLQAIVLSIIEIPNSRRYDSCTKLAEFGTTQHFKNAL
jgi:hypothetical protein